tara:strand:- start:50 stop:952 length:903 start_codon:yes stop_codon:yes gene_type:complete
MNNITELHPTSNPFNQESELYFDTYERPIYFGGYSKANELPEYYQDPEHKAIVRMLDGKPKQIGLVGKNYKVLPMKDICLQVEDTFMDTMSNQELASVTTKDSISYHGGLCHREYIFPNINTDIGSSKSDIAFRTIIINGYDGSSSFKFYNGAIDFFCTNGMVTGIYDMTVKRHTAGLTVPKLDNKLRESIDIFYKQSATWSKWVGKEICDEDAEECFKAMPNISERRVDQLMRQFKIECDSHGRTVWALYSAATFYATHTEGNFSVRETGQQNKAATLMNREKQVRSWLNTDGFMELAA